MRDKSKTRSELTEEPKEIKKRSGADGGALHSAGSTSQPHSDRQSLYKSFYEFSPLMNFTIDREGVVRAVNSIGAEHLGYSAGELIGQPVINVFHSKDRKSVIAQLKKCLNNPNKVHTWEIRKVKKDGSMICVTWSDRCLTPTRRSSAIEKPA
jgi:PAS domain S-box-containing protein